MNKIVEKIDIVSIRMCKDESIDYGKRSIGSSTDAYVLFKEMLSGCDREKLLVAAVDTKNRPTAIEICSVGTLNSSLVHPREIFKMSILSNANKIIIGHNHPSGVVDPSFEDDEITRRLKEAGRVLGIELMDHIIVGDQGFFSYREQGKL